MKDIIRGWIDLTIREQKTHYRVFPIFTGILILGVILVYSRLIQLPANLAGIIFSAFCIGLYPAIYTIVLISSQKNQEKENLKALQKLGTTNVPSKKDL